MTTPQYQKIPGEKLTPRQFVHVLDVLAPKFGDWPRAWLEGKTFYFDKSGKRFLEVWQ